MVSTVVPTRVRATEVVLLVLLSCTVLLLGVPPSTVTTLVKDNVSLPTKPVTVAVSVC